MFLWLVLPQTAAPCRHGHPLLGGNEVHSILLGVKHFVLNFGSCCMRPDKDPSFHPADVIQKLSSLSLSVRLCAGLLPITLFVITATTLGFHFQNPFIALRKKAPEQHFFWGGLKLEDCWLRNNKRRKKTPETLETVSVFFSFLNSYFKDILGVAWFIRRSSSSSSSETTSRVIH